MSGDVLALYKGFVFSYRRGSKLGRPIGDLYYIETFDGTAKEFCEHYKKKYPNVRKQIFLDKRKPLSKHIREMIETDEKYKQILRKQKLESIL